MSGFPHPILTIVLLLAVVGCESDELARAVRETAEQQRKLIQLQSEVARSATELVEADAKARTELAALQRDLQQDQAEVGQQRDQLEQDRRDMAHQRHRDPLIAAAITNLGLVLACLLPLVLCFVILRSLQDPDADEEALTEFLVHEIVAEQPRLLSAEPQSPALEHTADPIETPALTEQT